MAQSSPRIRASTRRRAIRGFRATASALNALANRLRPMGSLPIQGSGRQSSSRTSIPSCTGSATARPLMRASSRGSGSRPLGVDLAAHEAAEYAELSEKVSKARSNLINNFGVPKEPLSSRILPSALSLMIPIRDRYPRAVEIDQLDSPCSYHAARRSARTRAVVAGTDRARARLRAFLPRRGPGVCRPARRGTAGARGPSEGRDPGTPALPTRRAGVGGSWPSVHPFCRN